MAEPNPQVPPEALAPDFQADIERLYQLTVLARWSVVAGLWLTIGSLSLWGVRFHLWLMWQHFTWSALRYTLLLNKLSAIGLMTCTLMTLSVLLWQSRNILFGRAPEEQERLHQQLLRIKQQGQGHPLWRWLYGPQKTVL
ncbi:hypothetical protein IQ266_03780 [filamentous cyanobacterium LEGE 11480]|uniref:Uncharacterized protein n=1 Tax=Romeriopsis navalis LEGE 11480 TaxID=2777977 RepID=A0A928Z314_9CYAN|nr:hypothetical protein [Romeriopsis navalis]MBE9028880.1 hypothetical protein [Romeriopsis navalis LEGE 11480]